MKNNGLLTCEQLDVIFQNLEELIDVNKQFTDRLQQTVEAAIVAGDEVKGVGFIYWLKIKTLLKKIFIGQYVFQCKNKNSWSLWLWTKIS